MRSTGTVLRVSRPGLVLWIDAPYRERFCMVVAEILFDAFLALFCLRGSCRSVKRSSLNGMCLIEKRQKIRRCRRPLRPGRYFSYLASHG